MLKVEVIGNLGADAEIKDSNGSKFLSFRVANSSKWVDQKGVEHNDVSWIDCTYNNVESKVCSYLKQGVKVFIRGNGSMRVYSSKKERMMKAGLQVSVNEIELCGGSTDLVPREVIDPETSQIYETHKAYWIDIDTKNMKEDDVKLMIDARGNQYGLNKSQFVAPVPQEILNTGKENESNAQK